MCPSKFGRQNKQAKGGRKKRTKSTKKEEKSDCDCIYHPRVKKGFGLLKTAIVVQYTQLSNCLYDTLTHTCCSGTVHSMCTFTPLYTVYTIKPKCLSAHAHSHMLELP